MFNGLDTLSFAVGVIILCVSLYLALEKGGSWQEQNPENLGFKWGYFFIFSTLLGNSFAFAALFFHSGGSGDGGVALFFAALCLLTVFCGIKALQRQRWALVLITLLSFNIILFVVNFFYLRNRWPEFVAEQIEQPEAKGINLGEGGEASAGIEFEKIIENLSNSWRQMQKNWRLAIAGVEFEKIIQNLSNSWRQMQKNWRLAIFAAGVWVLGVAVFVFVFQPYGGHMRDDEVLNMLTIMFMPAVLALGLYWVYEKFVR